MLHSTTLRDHTSSVSLCTQAPHNKKPAMPSGEVPFHWVYQGTRNIEPNSSGEGRQLTLRMGN